MVTFSRKLHSLCNHFPMHKVSTVMNYFAESLLWLKKKTDSRPTINSSLQFIYFSFIHSLILLIKRKKSPDVYNTLLKQLFFFNLFLNWCLQSSKQCWMDSLRLFGVEVCQSRLIIQAVFDRTADSSGFCAVFSLLDHKLGKWKYKFKQQVTENIECFSRDLEWLRN